jgi:uncharacterized membrane protein
VLAEVTPMIHRRFHEQHALLGAPFGVGSFGRLAEVFARAFGTPYFIVGQTLIVAAWIAFNASASDGFDPYPFILLNLAFSTQAAYAAPLILLAQTRQADRDRVYTDADAQHREDLSSTTLALLRQNTELTEQVASLTRRINDLTEAIHEKVVGDP